MLGVVTPDGTPLAFPAEATRLALESGEPVSLAGVEVVLDGGGIRARLDDGSDISSHQAFWFAWSQFHPDTLVWNPLA